MKDTGSFSCDDRRLEQIYEGLKALSCETYISFDLGMLSKYNYYTGIIFKGYTYGVGDAIVKGGRYDSLLGRFGKEAAAIGLVIVVDDLLAAMERQNVIISGIEEPVKLYYTEETFKEKLMEAVGYETIQLVTISRPSAYGEYEPYHFVETEQEFEEAVKNM